MGGLRGAELCSRATEILDGYRFSYPRQKRLKASSPYAWSCFDGRRTSSLYSSAICHRFLSPDLQCAKWGPPSRPLPDGVRTLAVLHKFRPPTSTTLAITSGTRLATSVTSGSVVTLTASVTATSVPVKVGQVSFSDASVAGCTDIHGIGTAQLTSAGTAVIKFQPGFGSHSDNALFAWTNSYLGSLRRYRSPVRSSRPEETTVYRSNFCQNCNLLP